MTEAPKSWHVETIDHDLRERTRTAIVTICCAECGKEQKVKICEAPLWKGDIQLAWDAMHELQRALGWRALPGRMYCDVCKKRIKGFKKKRVVIE